MADRADGTADRIIVTLPADPTYAALGRTAALAAGTRAGLPHATLAGLGLAVDETMVLLLGAAHDHPGATVVVTLDVGDRQMSVTVTCTGSSVALAADQAAADRFALLVDGTVGRWSVDPANATVTLDATA